MRRYNPRTARADSSAGRQMQTNLSAKLYEVRQNREDLQRYTNRPRERVVFFEVPPAPATTVEREFRDLALVEEIRDVDKLYSQLELARRVSPSDSSMSGLTQPGFLHPFCRSSDGWRRSSMRVIGWSRLSHRP